MLNSMHPLPPQDYVPHAKVFGNNEWFGELHSKFYVGWPLGMQDMISELKRAHT